MTILYSGDFTKLLDLMSPARKIMAVTPSDATVLIDVKGLYIGATGNVTVDTAESTNVTIPNVPTGVTIPVAATKVYATGTTASSIIAYQRGKT